MTKVAVIGSNSFSGSNYADYLLEKTKYEIIGVSRSQEKKSIYLPYKKKGLSRFKFYQMDLNKDLNPMMKLFDAEKPEYIVNFASQSMVGESWEHPEHWYRTNVLSTAALANSLKDKPYLKRYVHISTPEVYGSCSGKVEESAPFNPSTPYAASRAAADVFLQLLAKTFGFPAVFTRAANVYGAGQQLFKIIPRSIIYIKKGKSIPLHGGGLAQRSFIHISDVCDATLKIMENSEIGEVYHISNTRLVSIKELVKLICDELGADFEKSTIKVPTRLGLDNAYILDSTKATKEFGWMPKIKLEDGLKEVIEWIGNNWNEIENEPLEYVHKE